MLKIIENYLQNDSLLLEAGTDIVLKCSTPRLMSTKIFPILKSKKFNIEMQDDDSARLRVTTLQDLINMMKILNKNVILDKSGDFITIVDKEKGE